MRHQVMDCRVERGRKRPQVYEKWIYFARGWNILRFLLKAGLKPDKILNESKYRMGDIGGKNIQNIGSTSTRMCVLFQVNVLLEFLIVLSVGR